MEWGRVPGANDRRPPPTAEEEKKIEELVDDYLSAVQQHPEMTIGDYFAQLERATNELADLGPEFRKALFNRLREELHSD